MTDEQVLVAQKRFFMMWMWKKLKTNQKPYDEVTIAHLVIYRFGSQICNTTNLPGEFQVEQDQQNMLQKTCSTKRNGTTLSVEFLE